MFIETSQEEVEQIRNGHRQMFLIARDSVEIQGKSRVWDYKCPAIKIRYKNWVKDYKKVVPFDIDYIPNPFEFQYDMEFDIFLNYEDLRRECIKADYGKKLFYQQWGPTGLTRAEHLLNAMDIRWPTTKKPNGEESGLLVRNPWLEDVVDGMSKYADNIYFGGAGQGKTYGSLAFQCMLFDHFIHTKAGAQCTFSTVSQSKMDASTWPYLNKLYPVHFDRRRPFSKYAGLGLKSGDYTFRRIDLLGKKIEEGGKFVGVLIARIISDERVVDKLTGSHDPVARSYLLDEAQSTGSAPMGAYTNMFLHPQYAWFFMSGNYASDADLLGINIEPNIGWENVTPSTHVWEGTLKSMDSNLDRVTNIIHFNNDLSPAMKDMWSSRRWPFLPNQTKKTKLYGHGKDIQETIEYKRFWTGWRFEKQDSLQAEYVLTPQLLLDGRCDEEPDFIFEPTAVGSFDSAPASRDRNLFLKAEVGLSQKDGLPLVNLDRIFSFKRSESHITYLRETVESIKRIMSDHDIGNKCFIIDWSNKNGLIERLNDEGVVAHFIIYHGKIPNKPGYSPYDKTEEDVIDLETIKTFDGAFEKTATIYAHEKLINQQALGAYIMRMFIEEGRVRGLSSKLLNQVEGHHGMDKELFRRKFIKDKRRGLINLDDKDIFIAKYHFSTDVFDIIFQLFYMLYVKHGIRPNVPSLGSLKRTTTKPRLDQLKDIWSLNVGRF